MIMFFSGMQRNIKVFCKLIISLWACVARHAQSTKNKKFAYLYNISRKTQGIMLTLCLQINTKVFYKVIASLRMCVTTLTQSIQNNNFVTSLQYLKKIILCFLLQTNIKDLFKLILSFQVCVNYSKKQVYYFIAIF